MTLFLKIDKTITRQFRRIVKKKLKKDFFSSETDVIRDSVAENNENFIVAKFVKSGVNSYMSSTQLKKNIFNYFANTTLIRQVRRY